MKRLFLVLSIVLVVGALTLASCAQPTPVPKPAPTPTPTPAPSPPAKTYTISSVAVFAAPHTSLAPYNNFIKLVNERSKGQIVIKPTGGPEAIPAAEQANAAKRGVVQFAYVYQGAYAGIVPEARVNYISKLSLAQEKERGVLDLMRQIHAKQGLYYLGKRQDVDPAGLFFLWSKKKVDNPRSLAGIKIGSETGGNIPVIKSLGGAPTIVPASEAYPAMERGVVDYWITTPTSLVETFGMQTLAKYVVDHGFYQDATAYLFNLDFWNSLPPDLQKLMQDIHAEVQKDALKSFVELTQKDVEICKKAGVEFVKFSPEDAKWYIDTIYDFVWKEVIAASPEIGQKFYDMMEKK